MGSMYPAPYGPPQPPAAPGHGHAVASMVLGITSLVFCWWGLGTLAMVACALSFGGVSLHRTSQAQIQASGMAVAGVILGVLGFLAYFFVGLFSLGAGWIF